MFQEFSVAIDLKSSHQAMVVAVLDCTGLRWEYTKQRFAKQVVVAVCWVHGVGRVLGDT